MRRRGSTQDGGLVVRGSVALVAVVGIAFALGWVASQRTRTSRYDPPGPVSQVVLDLASGSAEVVGTRGSAVTVERIDRFAFGRRARERRSLAGGILRVSSGCPRILLGSCSSSYRLSVPDDVSVAVRTGGGRVHFDDFRGSAQIQSRSGDVSVDAFCGFELSAASVSGSVKVVSACAPQTLDLSTVSGDASAVVPPGRYRVSASTQTGERRVRGVVASAQGAYAIAVRSRTGDVTVAGGL